MSPEALPPGLRELEDQLRRRPAPEPAADFRGRVLAALANAPAPPAAAPAGRRWRLVWQAAAAVVLGLNLGLSVANGFRFQRMTEGALAGGPHRLPAVQPRLPAAFEANDRYQVLASAALASLAPAPDVGVLGGHFFDPKEEHEWGMP